MNGNTPSHIGNDITGLTRGVFYIVENTCLQAVTGVARASNWLYPITETNEHQTFICH